MIKTGVVRENDEWKRKEKSGKNREIHCTIATRACICLYIPPPRLSCYRTCNVREHNIEVYIYKLTEREHVHIIVYKYMYRYRGL